MNNRVLVTLFRKGREVKVIFRQDDFEQSRQLQSSGPAKIYWGSGPMWTVMHVEVAQ